MKYLGEVTLHEVLIMGTRLSLGLHMVSVVDTSEVDRYSVVTMCHDTERQSFEHRVILLIPLLQFIKTSDLKTLVAFERAVVFTKQV